MVPEEPRKVLYSTPVWGIQIRKFLGLLDPDPGLDSPIIKQKK
jgi:hypothetical protein